MPTIRATLLLAAALAVASTSTTIAAPSQTPAPPPESAIDPDVLRLRESAWRSWFAGDEAALRAMLPPEFIGIGMGPGPFSDLERTLDDARAFHAKGGRLIELEFPETRAQRYGDVVVLYGRFSVVLESEGQRQTLAGRLTEVFVKRDGRWMHPGWHLDLVSAP